MTEISSQIGQKIAEQAIESGAEANKGPGKATPDDVARMNEAMDRPMDGTGKVEDVPSPLKVGEVSKAVTTPEAKKALGQAILDGVKNIRTSYQNHLSNFTEGIDGEMNAQSMFRMQVEALKMNLEVEGVTKVADQAVKTTNTLLKG